MARLPKGNPRLGSGFDRAIRSLAYDYQQVVGLCDFEVPNLSSKYKGYLKGRNLAYYAFAVALHNPKRLEQFAKGLRPSVNELVQDLFRDEN